MYLVSVLAGAHTTDRCETLLTQVSDWTVWVDSTRHVHSATPQVVVEQPLLDTGVTRHTVITGHSSLADYNYIYSLK